jgi:hypothetical protein
MTPHTPTLSEPPPYQVIDLDSPFLFGIARKTNEKERAQAIAHGVTEDRPMSILGITSDGIAGVMGEDVARLFAAAPALVEALEAQEEYEQAFNEWSEWSAREDVDPNEWGSINRALREDLNKAEEKAKALRATALAAAKPNEPKG